MTGKASVIFPDFPGAVGTLAEIAIVKAMSLKFLWSIRIVMSQSQLQKRLWYPYCNYNVAIAFTIAACERVLTVAMNTYWVELHSC